MDKNWIYFNFQEHIKYKDTKWIDFNCKTEFITWIELETQDRENSKSWNRIDGWVTQMHKIWPAPVAACSEA
jgi:hypothetical protein